MEKKDIRKFSLQQIKDFFITNGDKSFRAKQVYDWLWNKSVTDFDLMSNLTLSTRNLLKENFVINCISVYKKQISSDGTIKSSFKLFDNNIVEGVLIPADDRMTACVSSQVGCSLTCKFCATGYMDRIRNLDSSEIFDQVVAIRNQCKSHYNKPLTNIVYMGMGEPLLNYQNVIDSINYITSVEGLNMASKRITVSTAGISKMIKKLGDDDVKFNLALSLHAANDVKRNHIMPINETNSLDVLGDSLKYFYDKTGTPITYEYIIFNNFNDTIQDAIELHKFASLVPSKINIIEYNPIENASFINASRKNVYDFKSFLEDKGWNINIRKSRGKDIDAACGQLANKG